MNVRLALLPLALAGCSPGLAVGVEDGERPTTCAGACATPAGAAAATAGWSELDGVAWAAGGHRVASGRFDGALSLGGTPTGASGAGTFLAGWTDGAAPAWAYVSDDAALDGPTSSAAVRVGALEDGLFVTSELTVTLSPLGLPGPSLALVGPTVAGLAANGSLLWTAPLGAAGALADACAAGDGSVALLDDDGVTSTVRAIGADGERWATALPAGARGRSLAPRGGPGVLVAGRASAPFALLGVALAPDDAFVAALDPLGGVAWAARVPAAEPSSVVARGLSDGGAVVAFTAPIEPASIDHTISVARLAADGQVGAAAVVGHGAVSLARGLGVAADGSITLAGTFSGALSFGALAAETDGDGDGFVAWLDGAGAPLGVLRFGGPQREQSVIFADVREDGACLLGGDYLGGWSFGGAPLPPASDNPRAFVAWLE